MRVCVGADEDENRDVDIDVELAGQLLVGGRTGSRDRGILSCCGQKKKHAREAW